MHRPVPRLRELSAERRRQSFGECIHGPCYQAGTLDWCFWLIMPFSELIKRASYSSQGYLSVLFDLIYENNEPMLKILDSQGFKRIGVLRAAGHLLNSADPVDSIILSRDLVDEEDFQSNERFEKIRYYLEKGKYPPAATRSEKSRLRSAATHYRLVGDKLMLKGKEVISDPQKQFEISRETHRVSHAGINKTTAQIADKYHWIQIKKTVSQVLKNCLECTQNARPPVVKASTPPDKGKDGESGDNPVGTIGASDGRSTRQRMDDGSGEDDQNDTADAEAEIDDETAIPLSTASQPDRMLDVSPPPHPRAQSQSAIADRPHRAIKSPPGLHHHQLAQSIRSQHDAMSLSQRAAVAESALHGVPGLASASLSENPPVDQAIMDEVARHMQAIHQQHQHNGPDNDAMDDINMLPGFDDIPQFDESDLQLVGSPRSDGVVVTVDEAESRRQARDTALMAVAAIRGANAGAPPAEQGDEGGDGDVILEPFE
ncbi:hypothetical protein TWF696_006114 [Orbilia brochopaga]|uniref:Zinc finger H2C2-type histone UAS binding domain-containing protein n=1 Tax=Orbilia brochopaga TaxID=3140254 RepID=A0AAV9UYL2_9PEZI